MSANRPTRDHRLSIRLTPAERRAVQHRADDCQLSASAYVRRAALDAAPRARRYGTHLKLFHELANLAMAVDQLIRTAQDEDLPDIEDALLDLRSDLGDLLIDVGSTGRTARS